jgi:hypothetical protein
MAEQMDMQYWDNINGTTTWADAIQAVKDKYPKSITGDVTVGEVPAWVQEEADAWLFDKQLRAYTKAVARLTQYRLAEGREEVRADVVVGQDIVLDEYGIPAYDSETGIPIFQDITESVIVASAIDPLPASITTLDENLNEVEIVNPAIVKDEEERAAAQAIIEATPQSVIAYYEENK